MRPPYSVYRNAGDRTQGLTMLREHCTQGDTAILLYFETGFYSTVHAGFKLADILLPQPPQCWDDSHMPLPHFLSVFLFSQPSRTLQPVVSEHRDSTLPILVRQRVRPMTRVGLTQLPHRQDAESPPGADLSPEPPPGHCDPLWILGLQGGGRVNC